MHFSTFYFSLSTLANQLPDLPAGPTLDNLRGPIDLESDYAAWQIALAALTFALIAGFLLWLYLRTNKNASTQLNPLEAARAELDAAGRAADDERFTLLCANAVRRFIEARYDVRATTLTSTELHAQLAIDNDSRNRLHEFLNRCDEVKFAGLSLSEGQRIHIMDTAKNLIAEHEEKEAAA